MFQPLSCLRHCRSLRSSATLHRPSRATHSGPTRTPPPPAPAAATPRPAIPTGANTNHRPKLPSLFFIIEQRSAFRSVLMHECNVSTSQCGGSWLTDTVMWFCSGATPSGSAPSGASRRVRTGPAARPLACNRPTILHRKVHDHVPSSDSNYRMTTAFAECSINGNSACNLSPHSSNYCDIILIWSYNAMRPVETRAGSVIAQRSAASTSRMPLRLVPSDAHHESTTSDSQ